MTQKKNKNKKNYTKKSIKQPLVNKLSIYDHPYMQYQYQLSSDSISCQSWAE